ncbi:putative porin [Hymenobacter sp.]|uniref:putative porin n=1 Tax=Hymenobacter sp. TaxID=1898978 RepID=UPI00286A7181|nr:putative porin [Hymenobacter sp.]
MLALLAAPRVGAQVLDDSTKVVYGPKTTRVIYEAEVLRDSTNGTPLDTALTRWPQARFWFHDTTFQQDLGAVGSASRPLLYQPNLELGPRLGRNAFDKYARNAASVPYYDSRSPYSFFRVVQTGAGEQVFEISYSRSLKENFSVGVAYERIASNKIIASAGPRDALVEHSNVLFFSRYQSDNERYHLLFNYSNVRHRAAEQGGIRPKFDTLRPRELFNYAQEQAYLTQAANEEDRDELYLTQTYRLLGRGLTVYHTFDAKRQYNTFTDLSLLTAREDGVTDGAFFPRVLRNTAATLDRADFRQVENTLGVLGRTAAVEYRLYGRARRADLVTQTLQPSPDNAGLNLMRAVDPRRSPFVGFVGGTAAFNYRTIYAVEAAGEYKFFDEYWLRAAVRTGPLSAEFLSSVYSPTLTQQEFVGNHYEWYHSTDSGNAFKNTSANQLTGRLRLKLPNLLGLTDQRFEASVSGVAINDLVYYGIAGEPAQINDARNLLIGYARHRARLGRVSFDNQATYTRGGDVEGLRIPTLVTTSRVYYESYIFRKALFSQVGAELYYQSKFQAFDYSPSTQQFYQQNSFTIRNYPIADVFFVADIKAVSVFLKVAYVNQGIYRDGYFASPYYSGYPRRFQLGVKWNFFN